MNTMTEPHPNAYVTVVGRIAHRNGPWKQQDLPASAACNPRVKGASLSYGWARHTRDVTPCARPGCFPAAAAAEPPEQGGEDRLWMSSRRRNADHHRLPPGQGKTPCGKYAGPDEGGALDNGQIVTAATVAELGSKPCRTCWPADA